MEKRDQDFYSAGQQGLAISSFPDQRAADFYEAGKRGLQLGNMQQDAQQGPTPSAIDIAWSAAKDTGRTIANTAREEAGNLWNLATGEGRTEFPDMPELTAADIGPFESFMPNMKMGLTMDPNEKARIVAEHFKDDPRFGGVFADEHGNPIVDWQGKGYYVNKPGASMQDATDVIAQAAQFVPGARAASAPASMAGRAATGAVTYGATDLAQQYGTQAAGGKDGVDLGQAGTTGLIGAGVEALAPPMLSAAGKAARGVVQAGRKAMFPRYAPKAQPGGVVAEAGIPMTQGQRAGDINAIRREEAMRQGGYGDTASDVMRGFDERQLDSIRTQAEGMQPGRSGFDTQSPTDMGGQIQSRLIEESGRRKAAVNSAYDDAARLSEQAPATMSREGILGLTNDVLKTPAQMRLAPEMIERMPNLKIALDRAKATRGQALKEGFKPQSFERLEGTRKTLGRLISSSQDATEREALRQIKGKLDDWTDKAITDGLMSGDPATIEAIRNARGLAKEYFQQFGKAQGMDPAGSAMKKILDENAATPLEVVNVLTGASRVRASSQAVGLVKRMKDIFGPDSEEIALLKDAYLMKAFTGVSRGEREITRGSLVKGGRNFIDGDGKQIAELLFSQEERNRIRSLIQTTEKTITPQDARNPSRSAFAAFQLLRDHNLLTIGGKGVSALPFVSEIGRAAKEAGGAISAKNATSQLERLTSRPLVEAGTAASALGLWNARQRDRERVNRESMPVSFVPGQQSALPTTPQARLAAALTQGAPQQQGPAGALLAPTMQQPTTQTGRLARALQQRPEDMSRAEFRNLITG